MQLRRALPIDFDKMFGTWVDYSDFKAAGGRMPRKLDAQIAAMTGKAERAKMKLRLHIYLCVIATCVFPRVFNRCSL